MGGNQQQDLECWSALGGLCPCSAWRRCPSGWRSPGPRWPTSSPGGRTCAWHLPRRPRVLPGWSRTCCSRSCDHSVDLLLTSRLQTKEAWGVDGWLNFHHKFQLTAPCRRAHRELWTWQDHSEGGRGPQSILCPSRHTCWSISAKSSSEKVIFQTLLVLFCSRRSAFSWIFGLVHRRVLLPAPWQCYLRLSEQTRLPLRSFMASSTTRKCLTCSAALSASQQMRSLRPHPAGWLQHKALSTGKSRWLEGHWTVPAG